MAALASIAENPSLVSRLFITKEYNPEGFYKIKLWKNGEERIITIDDYIPCHANGGPIFARNHGNELWVMLLEKAYAKLHGDYSQLQSGFLVHAMADLTGCPTVTEHFPEERHYYNEIEDYADTLWEKLESADMDNYLI